MNLNKKFIAVLVILLALGLMLYSRNVASAEADVGVGVEAEVAVACEELALQEPELTEEERLMQHIEQTAERYNLSDSLVKAVIQTESSFRSDAVNHNGTCFGLMQINQSTTSDWIAKQLGMMSYDLLDPYDNVLMGCFYLDYLRGLWLAEGCTDEDAFALMLISYNRGVRGCNKWLATHDDLFDNAYVREVLKWKIEFEKGEMTE